MSCDYKGNQEIARLKYCSATPCTHDVTYHNNTISSFAPPSLPPPLSLLSLSLAAMITSSQRDLYSGVLHKCGGRIKSWTKRWMILKSDYCLYYYKDANKGHLGAISLRDPKFKIRLGQRSDVSWPKHVNLTDTLALVTTPRTYFMYADSRKEADEWRKVLEDAHQELVEVVRTKSFSGYRSAAMSERDAALSSHSMVVGTESPTRLNGARMANRTDSLTSDASSVFGRQFVLSTSSEMDVLTPGSIDAVYDVVVQPLAEDKPHRQDSGDGKTSGDGDCGGGERGGGERGDGERGDGERGGGERGDGDCGGGERGGVCGAWEDPEEALYSVPPVDSNVFEASPKPLKKKLSEGFLSSDEEYNDYVVPPDASPSCPQNISVIVERKEAEPDGKGVEPSGEEAGLIDVDRHPERCLSQNSLEAFYDFAREVAEEGEGGGAMYDAVTSTADSSQELEGEKYEQIDFGTKEPQNSKPMENGESDAERHKKISALNQPLPPPPLLCSHQDSKSGASKQSASLIYEDIPDLPVPASTSNQQQQQQQVEALYEPVAVSRVDNPYSQVEYEEERESEGVGSANIPEAAPRGGDTPPLPPRDHTLSPPSSNSLPPSLPAKNDDVTTPRPVPKPRTSNLSQSPSDRQDPCQLPSDKQDSARSPSNTHESDQLPSNRPSSTHSQSAISPRTSPSTSPRTSPLLPTKISHAPSPSAGVSSHSTSTASSKHCMYCLASPSLIACIYMYSHACSYLCNLIVFPFLCRFPYQPRSDHRSPVHPSPPPPPSRSPRESSALRPPPTHEFPPDPPPPSSHIVESPTQKRLHIPQSPITGTVAMVTRTAWKVLIVREHAPLKRRYVSISNLIYLIYL